MALPGALGPATAAEIAVDAPIVAVTVYPQGASVTRSLSFSAPAGESVLVLTGLPASMDAQSLRVEAPADLGVEVRSVETRSRPADPAADPARVAQMAELERLQDRIDGLDDRLEALRGRRGFLETMATELPRGYSRQIGEGAANTAQWAEAAAALGTSLAAVNDEIRAVLIDQRALQREKEEKEGALAEMAEPSDRLDVRIEIAATAPVSGSLTIGHRVGEARWVPAYDAHLTTGADGSEPRIQLIRRAEVVQDTGEDWNGVSLTLSTTRATGGVRAPDMQEALVQLLSPTTSSRDESDGRAAANEPSSPISDALAQEREAIPEFGDFRADFRVPTAVSLASGGGDRSVRLSTDQAPVTLGILATPRLAEEAFLTARFALPSVAPLLPGRVALFRDGAFVGSDLVAFTAAGDEVQFGFGPDDQVAVTWTVVGRTEGRRGLISRETTDERRYRIHVENRHQRAIEITVIDRIPVSENEAIGVQPLDDMTPPTARDLDDRRGVVAWTYAYEPGEARDIDTGYLVSWPAGEFVRFED